MKIQTPNQLLQTNQSEKPSAPAPAPAPAETEAPKDTFDEQGLAAPVTPAAVTRDDLAPREEKDWTVLFYMNGNNGLSGSMVSAMRQLEYVGSNKNANLVAQLARPKGGLDKFSKDWSGVRRYEIQHNGEKLTPGVIIGDALTGFLPGKTKGIKSEVLGDLGKEVDMGSGKTLTEFLEWGVQKFPAKHYMVVMMGPSEGLSGMQHDVLADSKMTAADIGAAFKAVHEKTGKKIDVVTMDGSATNTMEIAYELKDHAKYMIGSQGIQAASGMPPSFVMNEIQNANEDKGQDPLTVANYWMLMNSMAGGTLSVIDLEKMDGVKTAWNALSQSLLDAGLSSDKLRSLLNDTQDFQGRSKNEAYQNSRDAIHFAKLVKADKEITDPKVKEAAQAAIDAIGAALQDGGNVSTGKYTAEANGMSVFGPTQYGFFRPDGSTEALDPLRDADYNKTQFAKDTAWDDVLAKAGKDNAFNNTLKKLGFSETAVDRVHTTYDKHIGKVNAVAGFAGMAGWLNAMNAWGGRPAAGFLLLPAQQAVWAGVAGSAIEAAKGVNEMVYAGRELKDKDEVINRGFDVFRAAAKGVANMGYLVPGLAPYASTAGMLMFMTPWIRGVYGVYENYKGIRDGVELSIAPQNGPVLEKWGAAAVKYFGDKKLQDSHERTFWQKLAG